MITYALILTFSTPVQSEEYVIDYNLTKQDCIERMHEEIGKAEHKSNNQMYKEAVEKYKAVAMKEPIVEANFKCVVNSY